MDPRFRGVDGKRLGRDDKKSDQPPLGCAFIRRGFAVFFFFTLGRGIGPTTRRGSIRVWNQLIDQ
jgi:hypothetical protein